MTKKFFYVCAGIFLLALSYHVGVGSAGEQSGTSVTGLTAANVGCRGGAYVLRPNRP
jgi:hypothetical protein